ncbi:MAG: hypothetical protein HQL93_08195 [Magnetococcales bacterium]|nr:hypothetical protein [Magnetococcales bacterium]
MSMDNVEMIRLVERLRESPHTYIKQCFADNLELDLPSLTSGHQLALSYGNNVQRELEQKFVAQLADVLNETDENEFFKKLHAVTFELSGGIKPHFLQPENQPNRCADGERRLTRYVSILSFYDNWFNSEKITRINTAIIKRNHIEIFF